MMTTTETRAEEIISAYFKLRRVAEEAAKRPMSDISVDYWNGQLASVAVRFSEKVGRLVRHERAVKL